MDLNKKVGTRENERAKHNIWVIRSPKKVELKSSRVKIFSPLVLPGFEPSASRSLRQRVTTTPRVWKAGWHKKLYLQSYNIIDH